MFSFLKTYSVRLQCASRNASELSQQAKRDSFCSFFDGLSNTVTFSHGWEYLHNFLLFFQLFRFGLHFVFLLLLPLIVLFLLFHGNF